MRIRERARRERVMNLSDEYLCVVVVVVEGSRFSNAESDGQVTHVVDPSIHPRAGKFFLPIDATSQRIVSRTLVAATDAVV